jgi:hypothetical protein
MSLWRKRGTSDTNRDTNAPDVGHNEQKHDILSNPLDLLHKENVRLGLYEGIYDLSIKSDDLSIRSEEAMREVQRLGQEIQPEPYKSTRQELREQIEGLERDYDLLLTKYKLLLAEMAWPCNRGDFMNLVPKEILMSHLQRSEGAEEVSLPIDFFRDLLYQSMPRTWVGLTEDERYKLWLTTPAETENRFAFAEAIEAKLKEKNS